MVSNANGIAEFMAHTPGWYWHTLHLTQIVFQCVAAGLVHRKIYVIWRRPDKTGKIISHAGNLFAFPFCHMQYLKHLTCVIYFPLYVTPPPAPTRHHHPHLSCHHNILQCYPPIGYYFKISRQMRSHLKYAFHSPYQPEQISFSYSIIINCDRNTSNSHLTPFMICAQYLVFKDLKL
jgi:hypothetical protein